MVNETEIVVVAEMTAQPGKAEALRRAIEAAIPSTRAEKGNSVFRLHEDRKTPGHFVLYERFDDEEAIDTHFRAPHFKTLMEQVASLADGGAKMTLLRPLSE
jgi:quinol monooxygenase YgiN